jgi:hypothetical protein
MRDDELAAAVTLVMKSALAPVLERLTAAEGIAAQAAGDARHLAGELAGLSDVTITIRERLAGLEARPPVPGPPGTPGKAGEPGPKGDPGMRYAGVYELDKAYDLGDVVTWAGGAWHCNAATVERPGDGSQVWTLIVKRGRDAKGAR